MREFGGMLPLSSQRQKALSELIGSWSTDQPEDIEALVADIDRACAYSELDREHTPDVSASKHRRDVESYRDAIEKARALNVALPLETTQVMQSNSAWLESGKIDKKTARALAFVDADDLLELLSNLAQTYLDQHAPDPYTRPRPDLALIQEIGSICKEHGVIVGAADRSRFLAIIETIMPTASENGRRDLVRQAFNLGKYAKK